LFRSLRRRTGTQRDDRDAERPDAGCRHARAAAARPRRLVVGMASVSIAGQPPDAAQEPLARIENVHFAWRGRNPFAIAIADFTMRRGERLLLVGPSGSGKSTFLSLLCGIVVP